jgi:hypothetical protein
VEQSHKRQQQRTTLYLIFIYLLILLILLGAFLRWNDPSRAVFDDNDLTSDEIKVLADMSCQDLRSTVGMRNLCLYIDELELRQALASIPVSGCPDLWERYLRCAP